MQSLTHSSSTRVAPASSRATSALPALPHHAPLLLRPSSLSQAAAPKSRGPALKQPCLSPLHPRSSKPVRAPVACQGLFGLGLPEVAVIAGIAAIVFGPSKLPEVGKGLGKTVKSFQTAAKEFEQELKQASASDQPEGQQLQEGAQQQQMQQMQQQQQQQPQAQQAPQQQQAASTAAPPPQQPPPNEERKKEPTA